MASWLPSLNSLRAFEAIARHLNYRLAAEELNVTPAAVKQLVAKLEDALGAPLVARQGRGLRLTDAGRAGVDDLAKAMRHFGASVERMRDARSSPRMIVSVEASLAATWLAPKLKAFQAEHPGVTVLIDSSQEIVDLHRSEVDVGIRYGVARDESLITHRLFDDDIFPACSPALANGPPPLGALRDLDRATLIHWDTAQLAWARATRRWFNWESWFARLGQTGVKGGGALHFSDYGQAAQAAIAGQGVVLASGPILRGAFAAGLLVAPFEESVAAEIGYDLVTTPAALRRPEVDAFVDWMLGVAEQEQGVALN